MYTATNQPTPLFPSPTPPILNTTTNKHLRRNIHSLSDATLGFFDAVEAMDEAPESLQTAEGAVSSLGRRHEHEEQSGGWMCMCFIIFIYMYIYVYICMYINVYVRSK